MSNTRTKTLLQYVIPAILTNTCIFLFTIIDGIFVGNGVGMDSLGADAFYMPMVKKYVFWWALFAIPSALSVNFQCFCRNDGSPMLVMVATIISTVLNIFLDWLFIFPMEMGIMGAALATGISQTVAWLIVLMHFIQKKGDLRIKAYKPDGSLYGKVLFRGLPEMIAQFATPVTTICLNHVLIQNLGDFGVNVFAIISYVASFAMSVLFGASEGLQPLFGQSYGAKEEKDLKYYLRSGMVICFAGSTLCVLISVVFARPIGTLFGAEGEVLDFTVKYMPQYAWAFIIAGFNTLVSAYLYSTKRSVHAIILNVVRSFVINILVIVGLSALAGAEIVWFTFGISECLILVIAFLLKQMSEKNGVEFR